MSKSKSLIFFGNERLATGLVQVEPITLKSLISEGYEIKAVVSHFHEGRSRSSRTLEVADVAKEHNIPLLLPENVIEIKEQLINFNADAAVLVAYGKIIPKEIIEIFPKGIINIHPSLLPQYRGPTPIEQAILDGVSETGVSIMQLTPGMDEGPVIAQKLLQLSGNESKPDLVNKLHKIGTDLLLANLAEILDGTLAPKPQNDSEATYTKLLSKKDGYINWDEPSEAIERKIRAYSGFPKSRANLFGHDIVAIKARVANAEDDGDLVVKCQTGWLEIQELTAPSGRSVSGAEFIRGYKK